MAVFPSDSIRTKNWGTEILTDADLEAQLDLLHAYFTACLNSSTGHTHDGTSNQGPKLTPANLVIASQAQGDILYASSATTWARLGAGTSGQFLKTQGAAANPVWANSSATNFRSEMNVMQASTTTITVSPGQLEINGTILNTTANTTLTISTAGNWAGGSSLRATSTLAFVGVDSAGNFKMHTTAPTHADYGLTITAANNTKRYASWSSTTYRIIGWFYMNATGSGELDTYGVSNIADAGVSNVVEFQTGSMATGSTAGPPKDNTIPQNTEGDQFMSQVFRPTNVNNKLVITVVVYGTSTEGTWQVTSLFQDSTANALASGVMTVSNPSLLNPTMFTHHMKAGTTSLTTFKVRCGGISGTYTFNGYSGTAALGGVMASSIRIEEVPSQLT